MTSSPDAGNTYGHDYTQRLSVLQTHGLESGKPPRADMNRFFSTNPMRIRTRRQDRPDAMSQRAASGLLVMMAALFVALRLWRIGAFSLWGGDTFVIDGVRLAWPAMIDYIIADVVHPPLFYLLARAWLALGDSVLWVRLLPVLITVVGLYPLLRLGRALGLERGPRVLSMFMIAVNGFLVHYAQEFRDYCLLFTLGAFSLWLAALWHHAERPSRRLEGALFVCNLLLVYSHYFGWLLVACEGLAIFLWQRRRATRFAALTAGIALLFAPWVALVAQEALRKGGLGPNLDWIPRPDLASILRLFADYSGELSTTWSQVAGVSLLCFPVALLALSGWRRVSKESAVGIRLSAPRWLALMVFPPLLVMWLASQFLPQALWIDRYFIFATAPYLMLVATSVFALRPPWFRRTVLVAVVAWSASTGLHDLVTNRVAWKAPQVGSRIPWVDLVAALRQAEPAEAPSVPIYAVDTYSEDLWTGEWAVRSTLDYYFRAEGEERFELLYVGPPSALPAALGSADRFWVAYFDLGTPWVEVDVRNTLEQGGYRAGRPLRYVQGANRLTLLPVDLVAGAARDAAR